MDKERFPDLYCFLEITSVFKEFSNCFKSILISLRRLVKKLSLFLDLIISKRSCVAQYNDVGLRIINSRKVLPKTLFSDVARELGIPKSTLSRYLKGSYEPKTERVYQLSEYFGVTPEWLMGYTNDPQGHVMVNNTDMGKQVYSINDDTFLITEKEIMLVQAYRQHEQLQRVIDKILDLSGETRKGFKVARVEKK